MGWRDNLQPGSFRGTPFLASSAELAFGRNAEVHEFPLGETPIAEDLGRKAQTFTVECFVIGANYMAQRDALIAAFQKPGPGTLIHPWQGTKTVQMRDGRVRETKDDGGMAAFSVTLVEATAKVATASTTDTQALAGQQADQTDAQGQTSLASRVTVAGQPAFVQQGAASVLSSVSTAIRTLANTAGCAGASLWSLQTGLSSMSAQGLALLSAPSSLAVQLQGFLAQVVDLAPYPDGTLTGLQTLMGFGSSLASPSTATTTGQIEAGNQAALVQVVQAAAAAAAVRVAASIDFTSYDDAAATREQLGDAIDDVAIGAAVAGDNDLWAELDALRQTMVSDLTARGASLARQYAYTPRRTEPALVIAYRLYGDASMADDIVARNAIAHPGFVPGGQPLQVLTDD